MVLRRAWESSQRSTPEDWAEWARHFAVELLRNSPSPALRANHRLAEVTSLSFPCTVSEEARWLGRAFSDTTAVQKICAHHCVLWFDADAGFSGTLVCFYPHRCWDTKCVLSFLGRQDPQRRMHSFWRDARRLCLRAQSAGLLLQPWA